MGDKDDVRKVIQDIVTSELKSLRIELQRVEETSKLRDEALSAEFDAKFEAIDAKFEASDAKFDAKIDTLSDKMDLKFELVLAKMESNYAAMLYTVGVDKRLAAIERKTAEPMQATYTMMWRNL